MARAADGARERRQRRLGHRTAPYGNVVMLLWRLVAPGVCRVVSDPSHLRQLLARYPKAEITRIVGYPGPPSKECA